MLVSPVSNALMMMIANVVLLGLDASPFKPTSQLYWQAIPLHRVLYHCMGAGERIDQSGQNLWRDCCLPIYPGSCWCVRPFTSPQSLSQVPTLSSMLTRDMIVSKQRHHFSLEFCFSSRNGIKRRNCRYGWLYSIRALSFQGHSAI